MQNPREDRQSRPDCSPLRSSLFMSTEASQMAWLCATCHSALLPTLARNSGASHTQIVFGPIHQALLHDVVE